MCSVDDKLLLQALLQGLDAHFKDLMEAYSPELSVFVAAKVKYPDDQDVLQNIFLRILKGLRSMSEQNLQTLQLQSWIYEVTRNAIRDYYRKQRQILSATSVSILNTEEQDIEDTSCNQPEELIEQADDQVERRRKLRKLLELLPEEYRTQLVLHYLEGQCYAKIAVVVQQSEETVRSHVQNAMRRLRRAVSKHIG